VFGLDAKNSGIPSEVWRYYLLANRPEVSDSSFSWEDLKEKTNGELLANIGNSEYIFYGNALPGNFVNRALTFCKERLGGVVPEITVTDFDKTFVENVNKELNGNTRYTLPIITIN
jgi:methionyl-tRNA synthetase